MIPYVEGKEKKEDQQSIISYDYEWTQEISWYHKLLLNRPLKVILTILFLSIAVPVLIYRYVFFPTLELPPSDGHSVGSCLIPRTSRVPCGPDHVALMECHSECCYDVDNNLCFHRFPSRFSYLIPNGLNWTEDVTLTPRISSVPYRSSNIVTSLRLSIDEISPSHLTIQVYNSSDMSINGSRLNDTSYRYNINAPEMSILVNSTQGTIFNTIQGPLIASENIWEMVFKLTDETMYGLGELPLQKGTSKIIYNHPGGLSTVPLIFAKSNGSFHGLLVDGTSPSEILIGDLNQISLRSITKAGLKLHLFVGPEPKDIMNDVISIIGKNERWEYWMLGVHVCSEVTDVDAEALTHLTTFIANSTRDNLNFDSHCGAKPIVFNFNGTEDAVTVQGGVRAVRNAAKKFVPHISPYIRYIMEETLEDDPSDISAVGLNGTDVGSNSTNVGSNGTDVPTRVCVDPADIVCEFEDYMLQSSSGVYLGRINNYDVVYPDYGNIADEFLTRLWTYIAVIDGYFLVNNWPLDQSEKWHNITEETLPYFNQNFQTAFDNTPQWNNSWMDKDHYMYEHNEYGSKFVDAFERASDTLPIHATSLWMKNNAAINRQDVQTSWASLNRELIQIALGGVSGQWLITSPVCGDTENFDFGLHTEICIKWYQAATYMPMIKIINKGVQRDPIAFDRTERNIMLAALNERLSLLPYIFTVLQEGPLLRPMFYQYPNSELDDLSTQFNVGDFLLIAPNLQPSQSHVHVMMPPGTWFEFSSGLKIDAKENEYYTMTTTNADFVTLIRSRSIVATQLDVRRNAELTRRNSPFTLVIAVERVHVVTNGFEVFEFLHASGDVYMSPNMTVHFELNDRILEITAEGTDFNVFCASTNIWANRVVTVKIYGLNDEDNNYDTHKHITTAISLCDLQTGTIEFPILD